MKLTYSNTPHRVHGQKIHPHDIEMKLYYSNEILPPLRDPRIGFKANEACHLEEFNFCSGLPLAIWRRNENALEKLIAGKWVYQSNDWFTRSNVNDYIIFCNNRTK